MSYVFISIKDIESANYKWIDARFSLKDPGEGKRKYEEAHVKNAVHWDLNDDLSNLHEPGGRQPLPRKDELVELFESSGLELDDKIIVYDDGGSPFATRAWWILQYAGFKHAYILLEGFEEVKAAGIPIDSDKPQVERTTVTPNWNESIYASRQYVEETVEGERDNTLIDARAAIRYRGETEPLDRIAGHIPGALNFDWEQLKENNVYRLDKQLQEQLGEIVDDKKEVTVYCGSGVTATPLYAMLAHHGYDNIRLYVGSYSDWVSKEDAPVGVINPQ
ncbi:sulfurtransferase [Sporosarcina ureilytica]|uniref:Sulfurtransferase n=1 Tax=Sporosarcina ureilytica TaxID=298596 RepID=A0A1D8JH05_9BACL|nr:sulfurtransferase [Sporosarcina ureilytica]AOV07964.1 sulfurtransferase [Sporosarcina ureilytica]